MQLSDTENRGKVTTMIHAPLRSTHPVDFTTMFATH